MRSQGWDFLMGLVALQEEVPEFAHALYLGAHKEVMEYTTTGQQPSCQEVSHQEPNWLAPEWQEINYCFLIHQFMALCCQPEQSNIICIYLCVFCM